MKWKYKHILFTILLIPNIPIFALIGLHYHMEGKKFNIRKFKYPDTLFYVVGILFYIILATLILV